MNGLLQQLNSQKDKLTLLNQLGAAYQETFSAMATLLPDVFMSWSEALFECEPWLESFSWFQYWDRSSDQPVFRINVGAARINDGPWDQWIHDEDGLPVIVAARRQRIRVALRQLVDKIPAEVMQRCWGEQYEIVMHRGRRMEKRDFPGSAHYTYARNSDYYASEKEATFGR